VPAKLKAMLTVFLSYQSSAYNMIQIISTTRMMMMDKWIQTWMMEKLKVGALSFMMMNKTMMMTLPGK
jgi:hypothetical protein